MSKPKKGRVEKHNKWGYIFLIPFILTYVIFQLIPLISTIYNSFFENYSMGLIQVGPNYIGLENYASLFESGKLLIYLKNTMIMWVLGFVPQILLSLLLGAWFSDTRLKLKASGFFKTVIYLPNLIMASAFAMLFFALFSDNGPVNAILLHVGLIKEKYSFLSHAGSARGLVGFMNFLMWFGNTTILLMAGMMGIDTSLFEAAEVDGATSSQVFWQIDTGIFPNHDAVVASNLSIRFDHIFDRWFTDVRCTTDLDKRYRWTNRYNDDIDHVFEQTAIQ